MKPGTLDRAATAAVCNIDLQFVWLPYLQRTLTACDDLDCSAHW